MMGKKAVIIIGEVHRDPAPVAIIEQFLDNLKAKSVGPAIYCEMPSNVTPELYYENILATIPPVERMIKGYFQKFFIAKESLRLTYTPIEKQVGLKQAISSIIKDETQATQAFTSLIRINTYKQELSLYKKIINSNIPYKGIDDGISYDHKDMLKRDKNMAQTIYNNMIKSDKECNVVICQVGILHVHRVTGFLEKIIENSLNKNIKLFPMMLHSHYVDDEIPHDMQKINEYKQEVSKELGSFFDKTSILDILVEENPTTGEFVTNQASEILGDVISYINELTYGDVYKSIEIIGNRAFGDCD
jgi:hypothetical protein